MAAAKSSVATARVGLGLRARRSRAPAPFPRPADRAAGRARRYIRAVLLLLDAEDVGGALVAGEQVLAVVGVEEFAERLDAADDQHEIVLAFEREHRVDEIVTRALLAQLDLQAVGEESAAVMTRIQSNRIGSLVLNA